MFLSYDATLPNDSLALSIDSSDPITPNKTSQQAFAHGIFKKENGVDLRESIFQNQLFLFVI